MPPSQVLLHFVVQAALILAVCRVCGSVMIRLGQPRVIGEMIAGILLGPSFLGLVAPSVAAALFPPETLPLLARVSTIGLILYMFVVGTHLQTSVIRQAFRSAIFISMVGIVVPFGLGAGLATLFHADGRFFGEAVSRAHSMLYLGAAMAVTAFPVLARIIQDRGIGGTALGTLALAAGCTDDAIAWCLLAVVLVSLNPGFNIVGFIGSHAVFVAFVIGALLPRKAASHAVSRSIEWVAGMLLVPIFFAYSGMSTRVSLLWSREWLLVTIVVILVASIGKGLACWGAARLTGWPNTEAMAIGALMNARGLMELIMLNIGLSHGVITPTLFTVMVLMTLATTLAAGPVFELAWRGSKEVEGLEGVRVH